VGDGILFVAASGDSAFRLLTDANANANTNTTRVAWGDALTSSYDHVYAFGVRASLFGANAPEWRAMSVEFQKHYAYTVGDPPGEWPGFTLTEIAGGFTNSLELDAYYPQIQPDSYLVLRSIAYTRVFTVASTVPHGLSKFTLSSKTTFVTLKTPDFTGFQGKVRMTQVYAATVEPTR
jgi:hypothetical protein